MPSCVDCGISPLPYRRRQYCYECRPPGQTSAYEKAQNRRKAAEKRAAKPRGHCVACNAVLPKYRSKYCSDQCKPSRTYSLTEEQKAQARERAAKQRQAPDWAELHKAYRREWYEAGGAEKAWRAHLRHKFGMTVEDYYRMVEAQGNRCAICGQPEQVTRNSKIKRLAVDHDHRTGVVRGLLCQACNVGLGGFKDDPNLVLAAAFHLLAASLSVDPSQDSYVAITW